MHGTKQLFQPWVSTSVNIDDLNWQIAVCKDIFLNKIYYVVNKIEIAIYTFLTTCEKIVSTAPKTFAIVLFVWVFSFALNNQYLQVDGKQHTINSPSFGLVVAPSTLPFSSEQIKLITLAHNIGSEIGYPETVQALLLQETQAGKYGNRIGDTHLPIGKRSYGIMQMKVGTAKLVLAKYPDLMSTYFPNRDINLIHDEEIITKLMKDDTFALKLGAYNFLREKELAKGWTRGVAAYNLGHHGAKKLIQPREFKYTQEVIQKLNTRVRPLNRVLGLD